MDTFNYSIVIRTLGNTGDKYLQMLRAIERQTVKPLEILVVIPEGYSLDHQLGTERIIRSEKGMVTQRAVGIMEAKGEYLLVLDDDLDFPPNFESRCMPTCRHKNSTACWLSEEEAFQRAAQQPLRSPRPGRKYISASKEYMWRLLDKHSTADGNRSGSTQLPRPVDTVPI